MNTIFSQHDKFVMTYTKCETKDTLCDDCDNTYVAMLETLEISVTHVYMVRPINFHKYYPLKPQKVSFVHCETVHMLKYDTLIFLQMGQGHLEK